MTSFLFEFLLPNNVVEKNTKKNERPPPPPLFCSSVLSCSNPYLKLGSESATGSKAAQFRRSCSMTLNDRTRQYCRKLLTIKLKARVSRTRSCSPHIMGMGQPVLQDRASLRTRPCFITAENRSGRNAGRDTPLTNRETSSSSPFLLFRPVLLQPLSETWIRKCCRKQSRSV
ncbi:hypothetical protein FKM82_000092 [Ascaphus truei]